MDKSGKPPEWLIFASKLSKRARLFHPEKGWITCLLIKKPHMFFILKPDAKKQAEIRMPAVST